jgi:hypothetical protein
MDIYVKGLIEEEIERTAQTETENLVLTPKTLEEYLRIVGKVQGLRLAVDIMNRVYKEFLER